MAAEASTPDRPRTARRLGGLLLWFATLGGFLAWTVHLFAAWSMVEVTCLSGHEDISGVPLSVATMIAVLVPAAVTLAALAVAVTAWRRVRREPDSADDVGPNRLSRTRLLATVGLWSNLLFFAIIAFDGIAVVVFPSC
jgi:hypothetical protein